MSAIAKNGRITAQQLIAKKQHGEKLVTLTAYDYSTAKLLDQTGLVDLILVGDSLGMVVLGYPNTLSVTMEDMLHHVKAVSRGTERAMVVADMPFMSVQVDLPSAVRNAARMIQEGGANAVKLEGATDLTLDIVRHLTAAGIPVVGHIGLTPQSVHTLGGFKVQGKTLDAVRRLLREAKDLEAAGAFGIVLEMVPVEVAKLISGFVSIPTIGIGAGPDCDGQILVIDDFLGKFPDFKPRFVRTYAQMGSEIQQAVGRYAKDITDGTFPSPEGESFHFPPEELPALMALQQEFCTRKPDEPLYAAH